jgi:hypothetical protein
VGRGTDDRSGRDSIVCERGARALASPKRSRSQRLVGHGARCSSGAGVGPTPVQTLACPRRCGRLKGFRMNGHGAARRCQWRDPDSNWGHRDFQGVARQRSYSRKTLQITLFPRSILRHEYRRFAWLPVGLGLRGCVEVPMSRGDDGAVPRPAAGGASAKALSSGAIVNLLGAGRAEPGWVSRRPRFEDSVLEGGDAPSSWAVHGSTRPSCSIAARGS